MSRIPDALPRSDGQVRAARGVFGRLVDVPREAWQSLAAEAAEPNAYYLPGWALAANAHARGRRDADALTAWTGDDPARLIGLAPVISGWRALRIPLPFLVSYEAYGVLGTPLLDRIQRAEAAGALLDAALASGARALLLRDVHADGEAVAVIRAVAASRGLRLSLTRRYTRSFLRKEAGADTEPRSVSKALRRARARLAEIGPVTFTAAASPGDLAAAIDVFLAVEASGWKGRRGTALTNDLGDAQFIREAVAALGASASCEIATLRCGDTPVAAGILARHLDRAYFFKIGSDERFAAASPGTQLMIEVTRRLKDDPRIATVDSTEPSDNGPIRRIWPARARMADVLIPLRPRDPISSVLRVALAARNVARAVLRPLAGWIRSR